SEGQKFWNRKWGISADFWAFFGRSKFYSQVTAPCHRTQPVTECGCRRDHLLRRIGSKRLYSEFVELPTTIFQIVPEIGHRYPWRIRASICLASYLTYFLAQQKLWVDSGSGSRPNV